MPGTTSFPTPIPLAPLEPGPRVSHDGNTSIGCCPTLQDRVPTQQVSRNTCQPSEGLRSLRSTVDEVHTADEDHVPEEGQTGPDFESAAPSQSQPPSLNQPLSPVKRVLESKVWSVCAWWLGYGMGLVMLYFAIIYYIWNGKKDFYNHCFQVNVRTKCPASIFATR
jgi:hypothetical protein